MRRTKTVAAVCFLAILGACLLAVLAGAAGVALGWKLPVAVSPYQGELTYSGVAEWFKDTCRAFCTTELPGGYQVGKTGRSVSSDTVFSTCW